MKKLIGLLLFVIAFNSYAGPSMRRCMLLPIRDSVDGAIAFKVFEEVEYYLKESDWCTYQSNSEILNIFANYKKNLDAILENKKVLKIVSEKTRTGSMIKVKIINQVKGVDVSIRVIGENGEDILFKEETRLNSDDYTVIAQTIKNWLDVYEKNIPYDGRVIGVLGNQFTIDAGTAHGIFTQNEVIISRPMVKRKHPLLKEIVDWDTEKIGSARIIHTNKTQSTAKVLQYDTKKRLKVGDWIIAKKPDDKTFIEKPKYEQKSDFEFGKLGTVGLLFNIGKGSATATSTDIKKLGGTIFGIDLTGTIWATRQYWASLSLGRKIGTLKKEEGTLTNNSNSLSLSKMDLKMGYKYLPMGFFYGPQVDAYFGYASYTFGLDTSTADGFTEVSFKGILLGAKGSFPIQREFRAHLELGFLFSPKYTEEANVYGGDDSASAYNIDVGGSYLYSPNMTIDASYGITSAKAKFASPTASLKVKESALKVGTTFTF